MIGNKGDLRIETEAILHENNLFLTPYSDELLIDLPSFDYVPTEVDLQGRDDLRKNCIFTINPATAVDLDDAMSCKPLENGNFEVIFFVFFIILFCIAIVFITINFYRSVYTYRT